LDMCQMRQQQADHNMLQNATETDTTHAHAHAHTRTNTAVMAKSA
jgi:hypothetical protein